MSELKELSKLQQTDVQVHLYTVGLICDDKRIKKPLHEFKVQREMEMLDHLEELIYDISCADNCSIRYYGASIKQLFGYDLKAYHQMLEAGRLEKRFNTKDLAVLKKELTQVKKEKSSRRITYRFKPKGADQYEWYEERVFPKINKKGELVSITGIIRCITEFVEKEQQLASSEQSYKDLFDKSVNLLFLINKENELVDVNKKVQEVIGLDKKHLIGNNFRVLCNSRDDEQKLSKEIEKAWKKRKAKTEWILKSSPEKNIHLELVIRKGTYFGEDVLIANGRDISERKSFEEEIRNSKEKLDMVIRSIPEMFYNVTVHGEERKFEFVSDQIVDILGYTEKEYMAKLNDGSIFKHYHPYDLEAIKGIKFTPKDNGKPFTQIYRFQKKGQKQYSWIEETAYPVFDEKGKRTATYGVIRDITERHNAKIALEDSEKRYRKLFEDSLAGVFRNSVDGVVLEANDAYARMLGYKNRKAIIGVNLGSHYVQTAERTQRMSELKSAGIVTSARFSMNRKDGKPIWLLANVAYQENPHGEDYIEGTVIEISEQVETQELLEKREKSYRDLIENSPYGIVIHRKGKMLFANKRAMDIAGYKSLKEVVGKNVFQFLTIKQHEKILKEYQDLKQVDTKDHLELSVRNKAGKEILIDFKAMLCIWEGERAVQVAFRDITDRLKLEEEKLRLKVVEETNKALKNEIEERKKVEARLRDNEAYTRNIISSSLDMICATDPQDKIVEFNKAAQECFGYKKKEIIGKPVSLLYAVDEERKRIMESLENTGGFQGEVINKRKNGERFITYLSGSLLYDEQGNVIGSMGVSRDITEVKKAEEKSQIQSAKLNAIVESRSHLIWTVNRKNQLVLYNEHFQKFYKDNFRKKIQSGDIPWDDLDQLLSTPEKDKIARAYDMAFTGKEQFFEVQFKNKRSKTVWMEIHLNPISLDGKEKEVFEVSSIAQDITDKKLYEEKIESSLKEKEVLLQEVHHRVKNNLQVISSILNLQTSYIDDERVVNILKESQNRIKSMAFIHESLYQANDFSKINFSEYVKNLANNLVYSYRTGNEKINLSLKLKPLTLPLDTAIPCGLIINELVSNALKYAFPGEKRGTVEIQLYLKNNKVHLEVSDDGTGLPEGIDYRNTASLGLQLVVTLVEQLSATIRLGKTKGTKFVIEFAATQ